MNEPQWVGIVVRPIDYSLKGAVLHIDTGPGLKIEESHVFEMERCTDASQSFTTRENRNATENSSSPGDASEIMQLSMRDGRVEFPDWASDTTSVLWIPVCATNESLARGASTGSNF